MIILILNLAFVLIMLLLIISSLITSAFVCDLEKLREDHRDRATMVFELDAFRKKYYLEEYYWVFYLLRWTTILLPFFVLSLFFIIKNSVS